MSHPILVTDQSTVFLPWGADTTVIPLVAAEDVSRVAAEQFFRQNSGFFTGSTQEA